MPRVRHSSTMYAMCATPKHASIIGISLSNIGKNVAAPSPSHENVIAASSSASALTGVGRRRSSGTSTADATTPAASAGMSSSFVHPSNAYCPKQTMTCASDTARYGTNGSSARKRSVILASYCSTAFAARQV